MNDRFGDAEPEDAWDAGDPTPVLVDNLIRRVHAIIAASLVLRLETQLRNRLELVGDDLELILYRAAHGDG